MKKPENNDLKISNTPLLLAILGIYFFFVVLYSPLLTKVETYVQWDFAIKKGLQYYYYPSFVVAHFALSTENIPLKYFYPFIIYVVISSPVLFVIKDVEYCILFEFFRSVIIYTISFYMMKKKIGEKKKSYLDMKKSRKQTTILNDKSSGYISYYDIIRKKFKRKINLSKDKNEIIGIYSHIENKLLSFINIKISLIKFISNKETISVVYDKNYFGYIKIYYNNSDKMKMFIDRSNAYFHDIYLYYDTGVLLCKLEKAKNEAAINFYFYNKLGFITYRDNILFQDLIFSGKKISNNLDIPVEILIIFSLLSTEDLDTTINEINKKGFCGDLPYFG
ncbi:hypothetical protein [Fusobacterium sp. PH5-44]|uniref:hypothetical protein n=1 Tax=unclassified Fusobacterium TaxID=2648384 RepID=UPI003D228AEB